MIIPIKYLADYASCNALSLTAWLDSSVGREFDFRRLQIISLTNPSVYSID